jgi:anti-sigma B factor antagonist
MSNSNNDIVPGFDEWIDETLVVRLAECKRVEHCLVIYLSGYMDIYNANYFQRRIAQAIEAGYVNLIFECAQMEMVSSVMIGNFTAFVKAVKPRGGDLVLLNIKSGV